MHMNWRKGRSTIPSQFLLLFKKGKSGYFSSGAISLGRLVVPSPKLAINHLMTFEKLHCKVDPNWFKQTYTQTYRHAVTFIQENQIVNSNLFPIVRSLYLRKILQTTQHYNKENTILFICAYFKHCTMSHDVQKLICKFLLNNSYTTPRSPLSRQTPKT